MPDTESDNSPKGVFEKVEGKGTSKPGDTLKGNKHRQQIIAGGAILTVLIAYLTYRKMGAKSATTATPAGTNPPTTATDVPSGTPAADTTVPFAAPTDTTGGGTIQTGSSTDAPAAPSSTVPAAPQAQVKTPTPHPAGHPALISPLAPAHPAGQADSNVAGPSAGYPAAPTTAQHPFVKSAPPAAAPPVKAAK